ncbi:hypothetical protein [Rufibacter roseus]|uniref:Uncharacterized protein n=1 Tax=Rufibacter roseus TaxID=1567108 RepID=A0ABW2DKG8_9BACT|nr:hypothetical protein [Rufibacter roseus]
MEEKEMNMNGVPKEHGFTTPSRYFDQLPTRIMERTAYASPVGVTAPWSWVKKLRPAFAAATMALVFVIAFLATYTFSTISSSSDTSLASVSDTEIEQYLLHQSDLDAAELAEFAAVSPPHRLEFIEVRREDVNLDAAMELLEDKNVTESLLRDEY